MTNLERLNLEIQGIDLTTDEATVYLAENGLVASDEYNPSSNTNKRAILATSLSVLESIANNPSAMRQVKLEDGMTITSYADHLQNRIDQLTKKLRQLSATSETQSNFFMLFKR